MKTWPNCTFASFEAFQEIARTGIERDLVWRDEGSFNEDGTFQFDADHEDCVPTLVDKIRAEIFLTVHASLKPGLDQIAFTAIIKAGRYHFAYLWKQINHSADKRGMKSILRH